MKKISQEAFKVLQEIINNENIFGYWKNKFDNLTHKEDVILRGCFKELSESDYISIQWADGYPYILQVSKDGYLYEEHMEKEEKMTMTQFEREMPPANQARKLLKYDVFLSHANADKQDFVDELNGSLKKLEISIFYDKESLEWGDNWKKRILDGTRNAEFAIIVISDNFFGREWTEKELNEFLNRQDRNGQKLILPILHNITNKDLRKKYPSVAEIQTIDSRIYTCDEIALLFASQLIQRLKTVN